MKIEKEFIAKIEKILLQQKTNLTRKALIEQDIEIDVEGDEFDEIQGNLLIEMSSQLNKRNLLKINQINEALKRISLNTYGLCEDCGDLIPQKRLLFNPHITTCVCCAEDREIEEKQKKRE